MNLPNKLTLLRVAMVPFFVAALLIEAIPGRFIWSIVLFVAAALTDILDGAIARRQNIVTDFGKFMDPLADKLLVISALVCFNSMGLLSPVVTIVVVARELMVSSLRMVAAAEGKVIAADKWGKAKTAVQDAMVPFIMFCCALEDMGAGEQLISPMWVISKVLVVLMLLLTAWSGINYMWKNREAFSEIR